MPYAFLTKSKEAALYIGPALACCSRHFSQLSPRDTLEASESLATAFLRALLKSHPLALRVVREQAGVDSELTAMEYLSHHGFPEALPSPASLRGERRRTPAEVRVHWHPALTALKETIQGLPEETYREAALTLSWSAHLMGMARSPWYAHHVLKDYYPEYLARKMA